jgi:hypothetical protein
MEYSICITTFSKRYDQLEKLIHQIRSFSNLDILICVNGDYNSDFNDEYRKKVIDLSLRYEKIYPNFFAVQRGLSKMWNSLVIHSKNDWCLILAEDVSITSAAFFEDLKDRLSEVPDLKTINSSYGHFLVHKKCLHELGYFDERLLGFGHEDGDIIFRYIEKYNKWIGSYSIHNIFHDSSDVVDTNITLQNGSTKYSSFNKKFMFDEPNPKYVQDSNGIKTGFSYPATRVLKEENQYPYESFFWENKNNL